MPTHTPTPWSWWPSSCGGVITRDKTAEHIAVPSERPNREANAAFIVLACNSHDALVAACEAALKYIPGSEVHSWPPGFALKAEALKLLKAALEARPQ